MIFGAFPGGGSAQSFDLYERQLRDEIGALFSFARAARTLSKFGRALNTLADQESTVAQFVAEPSVNSTRVEATLCGIYAKKVG